MMKYLAPTSSFIILSHLVRPLTHLSHFKLHFRCLNSINISLFINPSLNSIQEGSHCFTTGQMNTDY